MTRADEHYKKMTETPVAELIIKLGIPTTISMLITNIYNLADTYFVGGLGDSQQGATGILLSLQTIIQALAFMLGHGSGTFVAKYLADKDTKGATKYVSTAFFVGAGVGCLLSVLGLSFLQPFMYFLGSTDTILPYACDYGMWVLIACPFVVCSLILNNNLRYEGKAFYAMIGLTSGGVLNIFGDWLLIKRLGMGVYGAGLATAVSQFVSFVILLVLYIRMAQSSIKIKAVSRDIRDYLGIFRVGLPSLIRQGLTSLSTGILNNVTKPYDDSAIAAMSVVNRYSSFVMCVGLGIGQGYQPVSSFNYQAKKYKRVKEGLVFTTFFSLIFVGLLSIVGLVFPEEVIHIFNKSQTVIDIGAPALRYASIGVVFLPLSVPVNMLYQSIRKAGVSSLLSLLRSGAIFIPVLLISSSLFKLTGIQFAQPLSDVLTGLISIPFIIHFVRHTPDEETL